MITEPDNRVVLRGKVNRVGQLKYTPAGTAVREFSLAVTQTYVDGDSVGYFDLMLFGGEAEQNGSHLRIGKKLVVEGTLWGRSFRDRKGRQVKETKVIVKKIEGDN